MTFRVDAAVSSVLLADWKNMAYPDVAQPYLEVLLKDLMSQLRKAD